MWVIMSETQTLSQQLSRVAELLGHSILTPCTGSWKLYWGFLLNPLPFMKCRGECSPTGQEVFLHAAQLRPLHHDWLKKYVGFSNVMKLKHLPHTAFRWPTIRLLMLIQEMSTSQPWCETLFFFLNCHSISKTFWLHVIFHNWVWDITSLENKILDFCTTIGLFTAFIIPFMSLLPCYYRSNINSF